MKSLLSIATAIFLLLAAAPVSSFPASSRHVSSGTLIDTDGSDGYSGDYVVIFNPSANPENVKSTGDMTGLIETEVEPYSWYKEGELPSGSRDAYMRDVDAELAAEAKELGGYLPGGGRASWSFEVGDVHTFYVYWYSPLPDHNIDFKVLAKGEHCYIWTPVSDDPNVWPLDSLDPDYAQQAADVFDSKFDLMRKSFGDQWDGDYGDGRLSLLFYNIDDGWTIGDGAYIGGYFFSYDYYYNGLPIINIDTYPTIRYTYDDGTVTEDISYVYGCMVHEYQHLINYSQCGYTDDWVNEMMSAAAEEICFPGSSVVGRLLSWTNYYEQGGYNLLNPPSEVEYVPEYPLENGFSLYGWDADTPDVLVLYAQVSLFAQYLYTHYGNSFFHDLMDSLSDGSPSVFALENASDEDAIKLAEEFRVALTANTELSEYGGRYAFKPQDGYDPDEYYGIESPYDLLCPVVFTGRRCDIQGGGAICVKPAGGVYYPPHGAASGLVYYGVTRNAEQTVLPGDADLNGVVTANDALLVMRASLGLVTLTPKQELAADIDGSGTVTANDALIIMRMSLGLLRLRRKL